MSESTDQLSHSIMQNKNKVAFLPLTTMTWTSQTPACKIYLRYFSSIRGLPETIIIADGYRPGTSEMGNAPPIEHKINLTTWKLNIFGTLVSFQIAFLTRNKI